MNNYIYDIKYSYQIQTIFNRSIQLIDRILTDTATLGQNGPGSHGNKRVFHTTQISRTGTSPLETV